MYPEIKLAIAFCLFLAATRPQIASGQQNKSSELQKLVADSPDGFAKLVTEQRERINAFIKELIDYLDTPMDSTLDEIGRWRVEYTRQEVADVLGDLRSGDSVACLIRHLIEIQAHLRLGRNNDPDIGHYPCAISLVMIGKAAVDPIVWRLQGQQPITNEEITVAACVLEKIMGNAEAIKRLQEAVQQDRKGWEMSYDLDKDYRSHDIKDDPTLVKALQILDARSKPRKDSH